MMASGPAENKIVFGKGKSPAAPYVSPGSTTCDGLSA
jgi:hypothetical protein